MKSPPWTFLEVQDFDSVIRLNPLWVMTYRHNSGALRCEFTSLTPTKIDLFVNQKINQILFSDWFLYLSVLLVRTETSLVRLEGFEPPISKFVALHSIQLNYRHKFFIILICTFILYFIYQKNSINFQKNLANSFKTCYSILVRFIEA